MNSIYKFISTTLLIALCSFQTMAADYNQTDWTIDSFTFESTVLSANKIDLKTDRNVMVWLPPSYHKSDKSYPVIHYLHNVNWSNEQMAEIERVQESFSRALQRGLVGEFIFVVGDFTTTHSVGTFFGNNEVSGHWQDHVVTELVPEIDRRYRTLKHKDSRAISGDYLGGYGALRIAMHHPDTFSSVYALHPVGTGTGDRVLNVNPEWELLNTASSYADLSEANGYTQVFMVMAQSYLPNPSSPPFYADWIVEIIDGERVPNAQTIERLRNNFAFDRYLMNHVDGLKALKGIGFDWGRHDPNLAHVEGNRKLAKTLHDLGIDHQAEEYNGDMWSEKWIPFGRVENDMLPFFQRHLRFE